jgi:hypothetical protein
MTREQSRASGRDTSEQIGSGSFFCFARVSYGPSIAGTGIEGMGKEICDVCETWTWPNGPLDSEERNTRPGIWK